MVLFLGYKKSCSFFLRSKPLLCFTAMQHVYSILVGPELMKFSKAGLNQKKFENRYFKIFKKRFMKGNKGILHGFKWTNSNNTLLLGR